MKSFKENDRDWNIRTFSGTPDIGLIGDVMTSLDRLGIHAK